MLGPVWPLGVLSTAFPTTLPGSCSLSPWVAGLLGCEFWAARQAGHWPHGESPLEEGETDRQTDQDPGSICI